MRSQLWIKARLKERGHKLKDVAAALSIPPSRVSDIIKGDRAVQTDELEQLSMLLGLSLQSLLNSLKAGKLRNAGNDNTAPLLPVLGRLTGGGNVEQIIVGADLTGVPLPPNAETADDLYCYVMGDDSMSREIRRGSLVLAGDPQTHGLMFTPGAIFLLDLGDGRIAARQYIKTDSGEDWLMPVGDTPDPQIETYRFSVLPAALDPHRSAANDDMNTAHTTMRPDDVKAIVTWVQRQHSTPERVH